MKKSKQNKMKKNNEGFNNLISEKDELLSIIESNKDVDTSFQDYFLLFKKEFKRTFSPEAWFPLEMFENLDMWLENKQNHETSIIENYIEKWVLKELANIYEIPNDEDENLKEKLMGPYISALKNKDHILSLYYTSYKLMPYYLDRLFCG
jgi:hypothetical protein